MQQPKGAKSATAKSVPQKNKPETNSKKPQQQQNKKDTQVHPDLVRPDGSVRKPVTVKPGYMSPEEVPRYIVPALRENKSNVQIKEVTVEKMVTMTQTKNPVAVSQSIKTSEAKVVQVKPVQKTITKPQDKKANAPPTKKNAAVQPSNPVIKGKPLDKNIKSSAVTKVDTANEKSYIPKIETSQNKPPVPVNQKISKVPVKPYQNNQKNVDQTVKISTKGKPMTEAKSQTNASSNKNLQSGKISLTKQDKKSDRSISKEAKQIGSKNVQTHKPIKSVITDKDRIKFRQLRIIKKRLREIRVLKARMEAGEFLPVPQIAKINTESVFARKLQQVKLAH